MLACEVCASPFYASPGTTRRMCSRACRSKSENKTLVCVCGRAFTVWRGVPRKYCSAVCYHAARAKPSKRRYGPGWRAARKAILARGACFRCGDPNARDVHHVIPFKYFQPDRRRAHSLDNLELLCHPCHRFAERISKNTIALVKVIVA